MTDVTITVGDTVRHIKRGTRYRILLQTQADVANINDGGRYWVTDWQHIGAQYNQTFHGDVFGIGDLSAPKDGLLARRNVMAQVDSETREAAIKGGSEIISFFLYDSLDHPGQCFLRPISEFTPDRFELLSVPGPLTWLVQSLLPEEQVQLILDYEAIREGASSEGTSLYSQAAALMGNTPLASGKIRALMDQIASVARTEQGGDDRRMQVCLSAEERAAVEELSKMQDINNSTVIRQALRLYQAQVKGFEPGPPMGCMGD
ncbi:hypothetical protein KUV57_11880 [Epibacterium sp. DP7N7-1]|nr:hypothetical protein [Epibacterium sp. DP7N7-1]